MRSKLTVVFILGPTAIGKTALAVDLAKRIKGEIISADSMQIYKGMKVSAQVPGPAERKAAKHYLVELLDPSKEYSVAEFRTKAEKIIRSIIKRGKVPIVVGGSGLYIRALADGLFPSYPADMPFREKMARSAKKNGSKYLHDKLAKIDPDSASSIHPNDTRRIIRALEIFHTTGRTMSELKLETKGISSEYTLAMFGLRRSRENIYRAINERADEMLSAGLIKEVRRLKKKNLSRTAMAVLGYKEISGYLDGEYDIETAMDMLKMNTRRFSKRQMTWFRANKRIKWYNLDRISQKQAVKDIIKKVKAKA